MRKSLFRLLSLKRIKEVQHVGNHVYKTHLAYPNIFKVKGENMMKVSQTHSKICIILALKDKRRRRHHST